MLARACIVGIGAMLIAAPVWAAGGRYGTDYPICMEALDAGTGTHIECSYTSMEQCRQGASGSCFKNPTYVPPPPEPASVQTESAPPAKPAKPTKSKKSANSAKSPP